jgi:hypothetical protein
MSPKDTKFCVSWFLENTYLVSLSSRCSLMDANVECMIDAVIIFAAMGLWSCGIWCIPRCIESVLLCCRETDHPTSSSPAVPTSATMIISPTADAPQVEIQKVHVVGKCHHDKDEKSEPSHFPVAKLVVRS